MRNQRFLVPRSLHSEGGKMSADRFDTVQDKIPAGFKVHSLRSAPIKNVTGD